MDIRDASADITGEMVTMSEAFPVYSTANKRQQIDVSDIKLIIMINIIYRFTIAFKLCISQVFFDSDCIKNCSAVGFSDRQFPGIHHRLYLDIKISVAYNFPMVELLELTDSPAISRYNRMGRIAQLLFYTVFWILGSLLSTSDKDIKTLTPTVPVSIR